MLRAPAWRRRIFVSPWIVACSSKAQFSNKDGPNYGATKTRREAAGKRRPEHGAKRTEGFDEPRQPSLIEQLFPEETKRYEEAQTKASREIPRLPLDTPIPFNERRGVEPDSQHEESQPVYARELREDMRRQDEHSKQTTVLVLRNASPNLVEEDFRRLIPQGKHMEGWTLEQGDITKVIPGRNLATLEHQNYYYLLFSSKLSAFTYQGQATRIFRMASAHTPTSMTSAIPPPPGYMVDGMDAHAAIEAFALIPASQDLELRQLQPPLSPMIESIVRNQGYARVVLRKDRMPFEVRLTLHGPQLQASTIKYILHASGKDRALSWSGADDITPRITKWEPQPAASPMDHNSRRARRVANERTEEDQMLWDIERLQRRSGQDKEDDAPTGQAQQLRRTPQLVYILGFHTQDAAQSFVSYWHRRPMAWQGMDSGKDREEEDLPPVANAEMLW
ncbi:hypothetical protein LTR36_006624 [Oleoguttula mirabilis]|uniref:Uncharacterized protein n=1 Tax=Oleoguttula mirabilis TaxID=1507867 RepID=A0AAV9JC20_9PEZI|nr:hypothetical protein LTR36_006624 [Oleoguttula mirabilis]